MEIEKREELKLAVEHLLESYWVIKRDKPDTLFLLLLLLLYHISTHKS